MDIQKLPSKTQRQADSGSLTPTGPNQISRVIKALSAGKQVVITVSQRPTIDQMVAAIGLASLINKQSAPNQVAAKNPSKILDTKPDNRATRNAVVAFAGQVHPKIGFLKTDDIITKTVDNYRELVVSVAKNKVDRFRYSLDKKMARVHISPFLSNREGLVMKDLEIAPGDFNIDVMVAIGVNEVSELEPMIGNHVELLKKRQTITLVAGQESPSQIFGTETKETQASQGSGKQSGAKSFRYQPINWCQPQACCLSEMVFGLAKEMNYKLDETISTILLAGFLSATERVRSRTADAEQIAMISQLVKVAGIENKQLIIDFIENESLQLKEVVADEPAKQAATAKKSTKERLLTEQEATRRIQDAGVDPGEIKANRGLGLQVANVQRSAKVEEKEEVLPTKDLDDIEVDASGKIIHEASKPKKSVAAPAKTSPVANPITDADKLGRQQVAPIPQVAPAKALGSQQAAPATTPIQQPSLIPQVEAQSNPSLPTPSQAPA